MIGLRCRLSLYYKGMARSTRGPKPSIFLLSSMQNFNAMSASLGHLKIIQSEYQASRRCQMTDREFRPPLFDSESPVLWVSRDGKIQDRSTTRKIVSGKLSSQISQLQLEELEKMMVGEVTEIAETPRASVNRKPHKYWYDLGHCRPLSNSF